MTLGLDFTPAVFFFYRYKKRTSKCACVNRKSLVRKYTFQDFRNRVMWI